MDCKYNKLKGRIVEICGTRERFAKELNIAPTTLTNKLKGRYAFTQKEILASADILKLEKDELPKYFF